MPSLRCAAALLLFPSAAAFAASAADPVPSRAERAIHERLLVLDTHFDTPANLGRPGWSIMDRHSVTLDDDQVDYPRMVEGGVDGGFFAIYTPQRPRTAEGDRAARDAALVRALQIREMVARHGDLFALALTPEDAVKATASGKRFVFMSMENGQPFEADLSLVQTFRALGVTMAGPVHFLTNDLADSATDKPQWHGLSPKGREFVAEANRLGILLDASHASDDVLRQMVTLSRAPIILSHSGVRAVFDHPRNVSDDDLRLLAWHGGVIQLNAYSAYMVPADAGRDAALAPIFRKLSENLDLTTEQRRALIAERRAVESRYPAPRANFANFMAHLLHAIQVAGIDHVGVSGDFDGGGGVDGLDSVVDYPKITAALLRAGYSEADIAKVWGGNALRVLGEAQRLADPSAVPKLPVTR